MQPGSQDWLCITIHVSTFPCFASSLCGERLFPPWPTSLVRWGQYPVRHEREREREKRAHMRSNTRCVGREGNEEGEEDGSGGKGAGERRTGVNSPTPMANHISGSTQLTFWLMTTNPLLVPLHTCTERRTVTLLHHIQM